MEVEYKSHIIFASQSVNSGIHIMLKTVLWSNIKDLGLLTLPASGQWVVDTVDNCYYWQ